MTSAVELPEGDAEELPSIDIASLFDEYEQDRIREAASARSESPPAFLRDAILERIADVIGEEGHLECWVDGCEETFTSERRRRGHVGRVHSDNLPEGDFWCGVCGYGPTTYSGVAAHHGQRHEDYDVRPLDHEPDRDELLAPDDIPDHMDRELLEQLYAEHGGSITELCRSHDFDVHQGRVRHYLIEYGIHEPTPQGSSEDGPKHRNREFLEEQYDRFGGNIREMHRELDLEVSYRGLVNILKRWGIHDPTDPPGRSHGKGGPDPERRGDGFETKCPGCGHVWEYTGAKDAGETTACGTCLRGNVEIGNAEDGTDDSQSSSDEDSFEDLNTGDAESRPAHKDPERLRGAFERHDTIAAVAEEFPDADYDAVRYQLVRHEIYEPASYDTGLETDTEDEQDSDGSDAADEPNIGPLDVDNAHDLRRAYETTESIAEAAELFPEATYGVVHQYLIDHGIHEPEDRSQEPDEPELESVVEDDDDDIDDSGPSARKLDIDFEFDDGFQTVGKREERNPDRVIGDEPFCPGCGGVYQGDGLCESCSKNLEDDLVADGGSDLPVLEDILDDGTAVLLSLKLVHAINILDGRKPFEFRRTAPELDPPYQAIMYVGEDVEEVLGVVEVINTVRGGPEEIVDQVDTSPRDAWATREYLDGGRSPAALELGKRHRVQRVPLGAAGLEPPQNFQYVDATELRAALSRKEVAR